MEATNEKQVSSMAEANQFVFTYEELVELMLEKQGITEGIWALYLRFGLAAANVGPSPDSLQPAAILPVVEIGIQRAGELTSVSVDASKRSKKPARKSRGS